MNTQQLIQQYKEHTFNINDAHVKRIGNNVADVFIGEGFGTPTRMRKVKGQWSIISGPKLSAREQLAIVTLLN